MLIKKKGLDSSVLSSIIDKQNSNLAFLLSFEKYGFTRFECSRSLHSLILLCMVDFPKPKAFSKDLIFVRWRKGIDFIASKPTSTLLRPTHFTSFEDKSCRLPFQLKFCIMPNSRNRSCRYKK